MVGRLKGIRAGNDVVFMEIEAFGSRAGSTYNHSGATPISDLDLMLRDRPGILQTGGRYNKKIRDRLDEIFTDFRDETGIRVDFKIHSDDEFMRIRMAPPFKKL